jgi:8-oxo-dGTP pyrophosphatase MutT (NUDIX family)
MITSYTRESIQLISKRLSALSRRRILADLPTSAHNYNESQHIPSPRAPTRLPNTTTRSAVMLTLVNDHHVPSILYTKRAPTLRHHTGECAFPGGKIESDKDTDVIDTALREAWEEIHIDRKDIEILGLFHDSVTLGQKNPKTIITPVVAYIPYDLSELHHKLKPSADEVDFIFTVPLEKFLNTDDRIFHRRVKNWPAYNFTYQYDDKRHHVRHSNDSNKVRSPGQLMLQIWGVTAYMTHDFVQSIIMDKKASTTATATASSSDDHDNGDASSADSKEGHENDDDVYEWKKHEHTAEQKNDDARLLR